MTNIAGKILDIFEKRVGEYKIANGEVVAKYCPFCKGGKSQDTYTFTVNLYNGIFNCFRGGCNKSGNFRELCNYFGEDAGYDVYIPREREVKTYDKPDVSILKPVTDGIISYFASRRISEETVKAFKIAADEHGNIIFPFYRNDILTMCKFRRPKTIEKGERKEWCTPNPEPILFNMDAVSFGQPLVITEGEIDAMSLYEAGVYNVVSVPMGCNNLEFVNILWDWLEKFSQIIIFGDSDEPGMQMISRLSKRLGEDRCMMVPEYPLYQKDGVSGNKRCKDANEILYCYGSEVLKDIVDRCEPAPIEGVLNLADVVSLDPLKIPKITTSIPDLDNAIAGLCEGGVTVFSGKRGEGKSTISGSLMLNAIEQGRKVCAYSGELQATKFLEWIMLQATEAQYIGVKKDPRSGMLYPYINEEVQKRIKNWIDSKFFLYDNNAHFDENLGESIIKVFTMCARRSGCSLFLVDNLMCITAGAEDENKAQTKFVNDIKAFAVKYNCHVILVAHPRKTRPGDKFTNDDISGSANISNIADNVINVERPNLRITKNRNFSSTGLIRCSFNPANRRIYQTSTGDQTVYSWDHTGITPVEDPANGYETFRIQTGHEDNENDIFAA